MGELAIIFDPKKWGAVRESLRQQVNKSAPAGLAAPTGNQLNAGIQVFPEMGWGLVDVPHVDAALLAKIPGVIVRAARTFRHVPTTFGEPAPIPISGFADQIFDSDALTWAMLSIGAKPDDEEGDGILVGVVDSGVDAGHKDIAPCLGETVSLLAGVDARKDELGHGTHVIGVIAGAKTPAGGGARYGIAPRARVNSYRIYAAKDETTEKLVMGGIRRAVDDGCRIVVLASGVDGGNNYDAGDAELGKYVESRGALLFAAAGNESNRKTGTIKPTNAPANAPRILAVGGINHSTKLWPQSNGTQDDTARRVDCLAPSVDVVSALNGSTTKTVAANGTSAATAVAAGVAAAIWSRMPSASAKKVLAKLEELAASVTGPAAAVGDGRLRIREN